jgi:hypothetical protein
MGILGAPDQKKPLQRLTICFVTLPQYISLKFRNYKGCHRLYDEELLVSCWISHLLFMILQCFYFSFQPRSKSDSSKPRKVSSVLRSSMCLFICNLPYCVFPLINAVSSTPSNLCVTLSAVFSLPFLQIFFCFFSNDSFWKWFSRRALITTFRLSLLATLVTSF